MAKKVVLVGHCGADSTYLRIAINSAAIVLAAYVLLRMFKFSLTSVAAPALLLAMFCTESVTNTLVFTNINGVILLCEVLFLQWLLDGGSSPAHLQMVLNLGTGPAHAAPPPGRVVYERACRAQAGGLQLEPGALCVALEDAPHA